MHSTSAYLYAFDSYTGKGADREFDLGEHVPLQMGSRESKDCVSEDLWIMDY